tara:strand:+ start:1272 stop:1703 length:432 start_codon:yes stop_codon:yes gene_type:complete
MKKKMGGPDMAAEMLKGLDLEAQERILHKISEKDPLLADLIRKEMLKFEDLRYLTISMIQDLLRSVSGDLLGLAFRAASDELRNHFLNNISKNMKKDILDVLNGPLMPVQKVQEAQRKILDIVQTKINKGEIVISKKGSDEYV